MYNRSFGVESDGQLFKMQQEAARRAYEEKERARTRRPPSSAGADGAAQGRMERVRRADPHDERRGYGDGARGRDLPAAPKPPEKRGGLLDRIFGGRSGREGGLLGGLMRDGKILGRFKAEDLLLIAVIILLLSEDADDDLILILGLIFIIGI